MQESKQYAMGGSGLMSISRRASTMEEMKAKSVMESYMRMAQRKWKAGDVYAPKDLRPAEMKKWGTRRATKKPQDIVDVAGFNPVDNYRVRLNTVPLMTHTHTHTLSLSQRASSLYAKRRVELLFLLAAGCLLFLIPLPLPQHSIHTISIYTNALSANLQNFALVSDFISPMGKILHSRDTHLRPVNQRKVAKMVRRAIGMGIHPSVHKHPNIIGKGGNDALTSVFTTMS